MTEDTAAGAARHPRRRDDLEINAVEDGYVVYDPASDSVSYLNPTSAVVFELCDGARDAQAIAQAVGELFDAAPPTEMVAGCLIDLEKSGLVERGS